LIVTEKDEAMTEVPVAVAEPVARIYGQPMAQIPLDLYIPPDAMAVMLDAFEGPLDLLLYLIRKANINILDIPMAPLTEQYLTYVEAMRSQNLELAADYLVMAAMLIEIKSRMLLPRIKNVEGEEAEDPRAELARRLVEYEEMKQAARKIDDLPHAERDFEWIEVWVEKSLQKRLPEVSPEDLRNAWQAIARQARLHTRHTIAREELSVREHMGVILRKLRDEGGFVEFGDMFDVTQGAPVVVVHFLAMLELARERLLEITQSEVFAPIYVRLTDGRVEYDSAPGNTPGNAPGNAPGNEPGSEPGSEPGNGEITGGDDGNNGIGDGKRGEAGESGESGDGIDGSAVPGAESVGGTGAASS
jgi:segregation and condensation protein A